MSSSTTPNSAELTPEEYNEPVYYCASCHSLSILVDDLMADSFWDGSYCGVCGSADVKVCAFGDWLKEEERRIAKQKELDWNR